MADSIVRRNGGAIELADREDGPGARVTVTLPAGEAWIAAWQRDSTLALYAADGLHPGPIGTYLAALVMYERITGHDARALPARAVVQGRDLALADSTVRLLQASAHEANAAN